MRVALLASAASLHTRRWAKWLSERGHTVRLFSDLPLPDGVALPGIERVAPRWTLWRKFTTFKLNASRHANSRDKWRAYADDLRAFAPDVLHAMEAVNYGPSLAHFPQYPRVLTPWGRDIESLAWPELDAERRRLVLAGCAAADVIATNGPGIEQHCAALMQVLADKLRFFAWGIDGSVFRPRNEDEHAALRAHLGLSREATIVLSPRRADPYYGTGEMIDAWRALGPNGGRQLAMLRGGVGEPHWGALKSRADGVGQLHLIDAHLAPDDMAALLSASAFSLFAPRTDLLACTLLEAMACGSVPIVAPNPAYRAALVDIDGAPWPADRGVGIVARGHSAEDLGAAITRALALSPEERREACNHNTAAMSAHFAWDSLAPAMLGVYDAAIERHRHRSPAV